MISNDSLSHKYKNCLPGCGRQFLYRMIYMATTRVTKNQISWALLAEPAVRPGPPKGLARRLTPWAAQRISERIYGGRGLAPMAWEAILVLRASKIVSE